MNICISETIAPYWIDMHNSLYHSGYSHYYIYDPLWYADNNLVSQLDFKPGRLKKSKKNAFHLFDLRRIVKAEKPDVVIVPEFSVICMEMLLLRVFFRKKFRIIVRTDDSYEMYLKPFSRLHGIATRMLAPLVDNFILCDRKVADEYDRKFGKGIYFPIVKDEVRYRKRLEDSTELAGRIRSEYGLEGKRVFLYVGRLAPEKNIGLIIKVAEFVKDDSIAFVIVGDGELRSELEGMATAVRDRVIFTGKRTGAELLAWYDIADFFILPSIHEPFGAVVNESLIAGCFLLLSNRAGSAALVKDGINGCIIDPESVESLKSAILDCISKVPRRADENSLKPDRMLFSYQQAVSRLIEGLKD